MDGVTALVPRRPDGGERDRIWEWCRPRWEAMGLRIVEGDDDLNGKFNRSRAMNRARSRADTETLLIIDADVVVSEQQVVEAVSWSRQTGRMTVAFQAWRGIGEHGTELILGGMQGGWGRYTRNRYMDSVSACVAVQAELWDEVCGFDERFEGWGLEDSAFALACSTVRGHYLRVGGSCYHLWHARDDSVRAAEREANRVWYSEYEDAASVGRDAMLELCRKPERRR